MSYKSDKYSARQDVDEFEAISERLAADLRRSIRHLVSEASLKKQSKHCFIFLPFCTCLFCGFAVCRITIPSYLIPGLKWQKSLDVLHTSLM